MKLHLYIYKCQNCKTSFKEGKLPGEHYGEYLMRSETRNIAYLPAIKSKEFSEVADIIDADPNLKSMGRAEWAKILHKIFGVACDAAPDGSLYQITNFPKCPSCGSHNMLSWKPTYPPEFIDKAVEPVTHTNWNRLNKEEKKEIIDKAIKSLYFGMK